MASRLESGSEGSPDLQSASQSTAESDASDRRLKGRSMLVTAVDGQQGTLLQYADIVMDLGALRVKRAGKYIQLRPTEFRLLRLFLEQPERAFTRQELIAGVWGYAVKLDPRSINTYLGRLRRALTAGGEAGVIRTIIGYGYSLDATCPDGF